MKFTRSATNDNPLSLYEKRRVVIKAYQPGSVVISTLIIPTVIIITAAAAAATAYAEVVASSSSTISTSYGLDVSFPMQQDHVTTNYDWLPHNTLPKLYPTPEGYVGMPIQPLGNRQEFYSEYIRGCIDHYVSRYFDFVFVFSVSEVTALEYNFFGLKGNENEDKTHSGPNTVLRSLTL